MALGPGLPTRMVWPSPFWRIDFGRADGAAAAGAVFHHRRLAPVRLQMRRQQPSHHVGAAAGRGRHDDADGFGRPPVGAELERGNSGGGRKGARRRRARGGETAIWSRCFSLHGISCCARLGNALSVGKRTLWRRAQLSSGTRSTSLRAQAKRIQRAAKLELRRKCCLRMTVANAASLPEYKRR